MGRRTFNDIMNDRENNRRRSFDEIYNDRSSNSGRRSFTQIMDERGTYIPSNTRTETNMQDPAAVNAVEMIKNNSINTGESNISSVFDEIPENSYDNLNKAYKNFMEAGVMMTLRSDYGYSEEQATDIANRWKTDFQEAKKIEKAEENKKRERI